MNERIEQCKNDIKKLQEELQRLEREQLENTYKIGDMFIYSGEYFLLSQVGYHKVCLICINEGNRWREPVTIDDTQEIRKAEFHKIAGSGFEKVLGTLVFKETSPNKYGY